MRVENHVHVRHIILYHFEKGNTADEAFRDINELFGFFARGIDMLPSKLEAVIEVDGEYALE